MKRRLITSALPYVNNVPHLGNLIQVLSADVFARYCRLAGYETLYICGTDEYGTATETRAAEEGISPRALCDRYHALHTKIYEWFNIAFDKWGRTSTPIHTEVTQGLFRALDERGFILERQIEQLYCEKCGRFLADRYVRGVCPACGYEGARGDQCEKCGKLLDPTELKDPRCASCGATPVVRSTSHLYIDLPKLRGQLEAWIAGAAKKGFWAHNAIQMTEAWIRDGLHERAITRDLKWGIPVPRAGYENKVFYVWFDAPIGYISITGNRGDDLAGSGAGGVAGVSPAEGGSGERRGGAVGANNYSPLRGDSRAVRSEGGDFPPHFPDWHAFVDYWWKDPDNVELFQFIGKDNIPFHTVIFPSSQLGSGERWTMLHHLSSTEYLNYESGKFSKSRGIGVFGTDAMETGIPADMWRFYLFYNRPEKADSLFTWKDFQEKVNGELIGNLGNLVNRTLSFVSRFYGGAFPRASLGSAFWDKAADFEQQIAAKLERAELRDAFRLIFDLASYGNKTFQDGEPWKRVKDDPPAADAVIGTLCRLVRGLAILVEPFLPETASRIAAFFGETFDRGVPGALTWKDLAEQGPLEGTLVKSEILFHKLEDDVVSALRERYAGTQAERGAERGESAADLIARFTRTVDLRCARIVRVEKHPQADKLFIITLEIAGEERVIVSGLVGHYTEVQLEGKRIIVAYNLKPAKLRGIESRGMLLAASDMKGQGPDGAPAERVEVLDAGDAPTGTRVLLEGAAGAEPPERQISIDEFLACPIAVRANAVLCGGKTLCLAGKPVSTAIIAEGGVH
ncbi:MAG: methionine--tRNA ligase [Treponema sp.]|jgi:methionyl-tRNA synthetase|nr:methionine--tRNA ligase [Treponema sp.]